ncbi:MAG: hypothetical protein JO285_15515 [Kutzneria sp.]|nr:hypothetical protein [Kutzneria sp.]
MDATWAASRLVAEPLLPPGDRCVILTDGNFGSVPRAYVECLNDRALGPAAQRRMHTMTRCRHVYQLAADHSPFLSDPDGLTDCLLDATARFSRGDKDRCPGEAELADIRIRAETA